MTEDAKIETNVDEEIKEILADLEQVYTNKFYIGWGQEGIIRLTFADIIDQKNEETHNYIISLLMTPNGLISLKMMIDNFIAMRQTENFIVMRQTENQDIAEPAKPAKPAKPERETLN